MTLKYDLLKGEIYAMTECYISPEGQSYVTIVEGCNRTHLFCYRSNQNKGLPALVPFINTPGIIEHPRLGIFN